MAISHYRYTSTTQGGRLLQAALTSFEQGLTIGKNILLAGPTLIDGDGSNATQFDAFTAYFGFLSNADAKAAWEEFESFMSKFTGDGSVSSVNAAMLQAFARFR